MGWVAKNAVGQSSGVWSSWDSDRFEYIEGWVIEGAVGVKGKWVENRKVVIIVNIYGPSESWEKIKLWNGILEWMELRY